MIKNDLQRSGSHRFRPSLAPSRLESRTLLAGTLFASLGSGELAKINVGSGASTIVGTIGHVMDDLAVQSNGQMYGIAGGTLYKIDKIKPEATEVGFVGWSVHGIAFGPNNTLFASSFSTLYTLNVNTGVPTVVGDFGSSFWVGEIEFGADGTLYADGNLWSAYLLELNTSDGRARLIGNMNYSIGAMARGDGNLMYGIEYGWKPKLLNIDLSNGEGTLVTTISGLDYKYVYGAGFDPTSSGGGGDSLPSPVISFSPASVVVNESAGEAILTVQRSGADLTKASTFNFATSNGTAVSIYDYLTKTGTVTFQPNETTTQFSIRIVDDTNSESDESFYVTLTAGANAQIGVGTATVTIQDNDGGGDDGGGGGTSVVSLDTTSASIRENAIIKSVTLTLTRTGSTAGSSSIGYATEDVTGRAGIDYLARNGTLVFKAGERTKTIEITILDDNLYEGDEIFRLKIWAISGAVVGASVCTLTILDNDPVSDPVVLVLGQSMTEVREDAKSVKVTIIRSGDTSKAVSVTLGTRAGSATAGADFRSLNKVVAFAARETRKSVTIVIIDDKIAERNEEFLVTLTKPVGAELGTTRQATVRILDNDQVKADLPRVASTRGDWTTVAGRRGLVNALVQFTQPMNPTNARFGPNYRLDAAGNDGQWGTADDVSLTIKSIFYDASKKVATIALVQRYVGGTRVRLTVRGSGFHNTKSVELDGDNNGTPGGDYIGILA